MSNDYIELSYKSIECFANDGKLLADELDQLLSIALRDGIIDDNEKRVLNNIFNRLNDNDLTEEMIDKIKQIKEKHF